MVGIPLGTPPGGSPWGDPPGGVLWVKPLSGFLGGLLHHSRGLPLVLSEHGIYTKERQIDLLQSTWIRDNRNIFQRDPMEVSFFRQMWIRFFDWMGRFCYGAADPIIALYENNRLRQVADGAAAERTVSIPNGIRIERFAPLRAQRPAETPPQSGSMFGGGLFGGSKR